MIIDQYLSTKITTIQEDITLKSVLDTLPSSLKNGEINTEDADANNTLQFLNANVKNRFQSLTTASRASSLWLSHQHPLDIVQTSFVSIP